MPQEEPTPTREKIADVLALTIMVLFIVAMVVGMVDHTYQLPGVLQSLVAVVATFVFGHRLLPKGASKPDEDKENGSGRESVDRRDNSRLPDALDIRRGGTTSPTDNWRRNPSNSNRDDSLRPGYDAGDDPSGNEC